MFVKFEDIEKVLSITWALLLKNRNEDVQKRLNLVDLQWVSVIKIIITEISQSTNKFYFITRFIIYWMTIMKKIKT